MNSAHKLVQPAGFAPARAGDAFAQHGKTSVSEKLVSILTELGVEHAFGLVGGANAPLSEALLMSPIRVVHCRHEGGAAFAAMESHFASNKPAAVFVTTGPGLLNSVTGIVGARSEGAKLILLSGLTSAKQRGRFATQETSAHSLPLSGLFTNGPIFDYAEIIEDAQQLEQVAARLKFGLTRPGGFMAHIALPIAMQTASVDPGSAPDVLVPEARCSAETIAECAARLKGGKFVIWVGFGARHAAKAVRALVDRSGALVICSPRAKGIVPESHPQFLGVTGIGGHDGVYQYLAQHKPERLLVLGTRMGESTSFWDSNVLPKEEIMHVDADETVFGAAFPNARTFGVKAEIADFVEKLAVQFPRPATLRPASGPRRAAPDSIEPLPVRVRPTYLMQQIQRQVIDATDALVMSEAGNAFAWANHHLIFREPNRYRVSVSYGSMGHFSAGVVGAALGSGRRAVAIVGDGSLMMNNEINTAVQYRARAIWIVLNDSRYSMVEQGMQALGFTPVETNFPTTDFTAIARAMGAEAVRVETELELAAALDQAMSASGPFLVDVVTNGDDKSPLLKRIESLIKQGAAGKREGS